MFAEYIALAIDRRLMYTRVRQLDDEELDSGDDMDRLDRTADEPEPEYITQEKITMDLEYPRLPGPEPSDGEVSTCPCAL